MKKYLFISLFLWCMAMNVIAADTGYTPPSNIALGIVTDPIGTSIKLAEWSLALVPVVLTGLAGIAVIVILEYIGLDVVGWTIDILKFLFENVFLLIRWTLATEANLISMVVLFLILWIFIIFGLPKMM